MEEGGPLFVRSKAETEAWSRCSIIIKGLLNRRLRCSVIKTNGSPTTSI